MMTIGLIGTGYIGPIHLGALLRLGGIRVKAVCDANLDLARKTAARFGIEKATSNYQEILDDEKIQVIHNCTPNKFHFAINKAAIERGKHVLSEKPLAMTLQEAAELVALAKRHGIINGVDFCYRYFPAVQEMAVRVRRGDAGDVRIAFGTYFQDWLSNASDYSWRLDPAESGDSNITADLGSHWFDLVQFVTGLHVTEVMADFATLVPVRKKPKRQVLAFETSGNTEAEEVKIQLEDYSSVMFRLSNGAVGSFTTSQTCAGRKSDTEFQIYGSRCSMAWNHKQPTELWIGHREKPNEILIENPMLQDASTAQYANLPAGHPLGYHDAVTNLFMDFYNCVKTGQETTAIGRPTFQTGYDEMKILNALVKSNRTKQWVTV